MNWVLIWLSDKQMENKPMRKLLSILLLTAAAAASVSAKPNLNFSKNCDELYTVSRMLMQYRQEGKPMNVIINSLKGDKIMRPLVIAAYDVPQYSSPEFKNREINKFANMVYKLCISGGN